MKLKDILKESIAAGKVYSNPFATAFVKESEENNSTEFTSEQRAVFLKAVNEYKKFGEAVYRKEGLEDVYEAIKNLVEVAGSVTIKETGDWFDGVTVGRHMKRMSESFKVFEKTIKEVGTLQQRLESSYDEIGEVLGKYYEINDTDDELEEGNEFGASRAKAIANGDSEFEVDGKKYPVKSVDKDDKENAEEFVDESLVTEGRVPAKKLLQMVVKGNTKEVEGIKLSKEMAQSFLDWMQQSPFGKKYSQLPFHMLLKASFNWGLHRHADKKSKEYKDLEMASKRVKSESVNESTFAGWIAGYNGKKIEIKKGEAKDLYNAKLLAIKKLKVPKSKVGLMFIKPAVDESVMNENKYTIIDPRGNTAGTGTKDQANKRQKKLGGNKKGYFVVPAKSALKARRAMERFKFDFKNAKLQDKMSGLYFDDEMFGESTMNEAKYDIGMARKGNGLTVYNKAEEENGDYKTIAHIDNKGKVKYFDKKLPNNIKKEIENEMAKMKESIAETKGNTMKLKNLLKESIGMGELPSSKLMKMKVSAKDMLESVGEDDVKKSEEELSEGASSEEKRIVMLAVRKIAKYRNVPIDQSVVDVQRAAEELERDIKKGKVKK